MKDLKTRLLLPLSNAALYLVACAVIATGLLLEFRMDEEDGAVRVLGLGSDDWGEVHFGLALGFAALTVLHLLLNRAWIKAAMMKTKWAGPALAVGLGFVLVVLLWPADHGAVGRDGEATHYQQDDD
jgi:hypothetical protein